MHCYNLRAPLPGSRESVVALGYFDGVHLGHRAVLCRGAQLAAEQGLAAAVFTFTAGLGGAGKGRRLLTETEKRRRIAQCGIEEYFSPPFEDFRGLSPEGFVEEILQGCLRARHVLCGQNFTFGAKKSGNVAVLQALCAEKGIAVHLVPTTLCQGERVSSTRIRECLQQGDAALAAVLLGEPYTIDLPVQHGKKLGSTLGFPTINQIYPPHMLLPKQGVYLTRVLLNGQWLPSATGLGTRPTVQGEGVTCETFIPNFSGQLYGETVCVQFCQYYKPTVKFDSLEALRAYIQDAANATLALAQEIAVSNRI